MKKTTLLLLFIWVLLNQTAANAYSQGITLSFKSAPLSTIFKEIEKQTSFDFIYPADELYARKVTITVTNAKLEEVMELCLQGLPFTYSVNEKRIVVKKVEEKAPGGATDKIDPIELTGKVTDVNGKPVAGATVTVRGTNIFTATDSDGNFVIKGVDAKASIMVTNVGFEPQIVSLRGKTDLSIKLLVTAQVMKEVVISTGYQKVSAEKFVGSYAQLDSGAFHRRVGMGIIERLDGTVPGILFSKKGGAAPIQIRGISSLGAGSSSSLLFNPLIVVDNFAMDARFDITSINPNDVESITVLKDAAATSIWGSRAGNGVIVIVTKGSKFNQPLQISISTNFGITNKPDLFYNKRVKTSDFIDIESDLYRLGFYDDNINNTYGRPVISPVVEILDRRKNNLISPEDSAIFINELRSVDIRDELLSDVFQPALKQEYYLSASGGNKNINYSISGGAFFDNGIYKGSIGNKKYTVNSKLFLRPFDKFEIQVNIGYTNSSIRNTPFVFLDGVPSVPYIKLKNAKGEPASVPFGNRMGYLDTVGNGQLLDWSYRPLEEMRIANITQGVQNLTINLGASYQFLKWLKTNIQFQSMTQEIDKTQIFDKNSFYVRNLVNSFTDLSQTENFLRNPVPIGGILDNVYEKAKGINFRGTLNIDHTWNMDHQISSVLGFEFSENKGNFNTNRLYGYDDNIGTFRTNMDYYNRYPVFYIFAPGSSEVIPSSSAYGEQANNRFVSLLANLAYSFKGIYSFYASARRDGANVFGVKTNNKWKPLWSVGGSWALSKENFFTIPWISSLRVRSSFGYSGNANISGSGKFTLSYSSPSFTQLIDVPFASAGNAPNPQLRWEQVRIINLAVDFSIFNRISGSVDFFSKKSTDLISMLPLDPTVGISLYPVNSASLKGSGFEISLNSKNKIGNIDWNVNLGFSHVKTIVTKVYNGGYKAIDFVTFGLKPGEGKPAFALSSYRWAGLDSLTGDPQGYLSGKVSKKYMDIFNDSVENQKLNGTSIPLYTGNLLNSFTWRNFSFSFNLIGRFKYYFRKPSLEINHTGNLGGQNYIDEYYSRWQKPGDEKKTNVPSVLFPVPNEVINRNTFYKGAEVNVLKGDNIRIQDFRLGYTLDRSLLKSTPIKNIQLFFYPNNLNLILWRAERSVFDPDYSGGSDATAAPIPRTWTFGATINF